MGFGMSSSNNTTECSTSSSVELNGSNQINEEIMTEDMSIFKDVDWSCVNNDTFFMETLTLESNPDDYSLPMSNTFSRIISVETDHLSEMALTKAFLPNYKEISTNLGEQMVSELDPDLPAFRAEEEPSGKDIFRVWDLGVSVEGEEEEEELARQLDWLAPESLLRMNPNFDDLEAWNDLKQEEDDDLVVAISDLSLIP